MNIEEIKERHSKIGGTPWKASEYSTDYYKQGYAILTWNDGYIAECMEDLGHVDFIANSPSDIAYLLSIIEQAEKALEKITEEKNIETKESAVLMGIAAITINNHRTIANEALKAIRGG